MKPDRPKTELTAELIGHLLGYIRNQFYHGDPKFFAQQDHLKEVLLELAVWLNKRSVWMPADTYEKTLKGILDDIKINCRVEVLYWPRYLQHCIQQHLAHHGDEIYEAAKSARNLAEQAFLCASKRVKVDSTDQATRELAAAAAILSQKRRAKSKPAPSKVKQLDLF